MLLACQFTQHTGAMLCFFLNYAKTQFFCIYLQFVTFCTCVLLNLFLHLNDLVLHPTYDILSSSKNKVKLKTKIHEDLLCEEVITNLAVERSHALNLLF